MQCDQCGARRPRSGPCPECGAPPPGTFSSMRQWRDQSRSGEGPAVGGGRGGSGANWGAGASGSGRRGSGANSGAGGAGRSSSRWDEGEGYDDYDDRPAGRSNPRNAAPRRRTPDYEEVDLERALVPAHNDMLPMDPAMGGMGAGGLPAVPGLPATDEEERMLGIRRPVYIPANGEKRKRKLGTWRVLSGVLSVMLVCIASCALAGVFGQKQIKSIITGPVANATNSVNGTITGVPVTPVATPGAQAKFVLQIVTAGGRSSNGEPTNVKTHFLVGDYVYVLAVVRGLPKGAHIISVAWYLNGVFVELPAGAQTSQTIDGDKRVVFGLQYPSSGLGAAKIYIDRPASDKSDDPKDPALADTIYFAVEMPTPAPTVGTGTATPGTKTPSASPTATKKP
ncbi:MAG: hypothetical protein ACXVCO_02735 [Ktedonobacterales bacterium]